MKAHELVPIKTREGAIVGGIIIAPRPSQAGGGFRFGMQFDDGTMTFVAVDDATLQKVGSAIERYVGREPIAN